MQRVLLVMMAPLEQPVPQVIAEQMVLQEPQAQQGLLVMMALTGRQEPQAHREAMGQTVLQELREQQALLVMMALTGPLEQRVQLAIME